MGEKNAAARWLATFPARHHAMLHAWMNYAVSRGARTPEAVIAKVEVLIGQKLTWSVEPQSRELCHAALIACRCNRDGAMAFAKQVLEGEGP